MSNQGLEFQIQLLASNYPTYGWELMPSGQSLATASYSQLFEVLGDTFGGNATNFDLPNMPPINNVNYYCHTSNTSKRYVEFNRVIGEVRLWSGPGVLPDGWSDCDGQPLLAEGHPSLFSVLGNTFGGIPGRTFLLPKIPNPTSNSSLKYIICTVGFAPSVFDGLLSSVKWFAGNKDLLPAGWVPCKGQEVEAGKNTLLYSLLGNRYGGNEYVFCYPTVPDLFPGVSTVLCIDGVYPGHL